MVSLSKFPWFSTSGLPKTTIQSTGFYLQQTSTVSSLPSMQSSTKLQTSAIPMHKVLLQVNSASKQWRPSGNRVAVKGIAVKTGFNHYNRRGKEEHSSITSERKIQCYSTILKLLSNHMSIKIQLSLLHKYRISAMLLRFLRPSTNCSKMYKNLRVKSQNVNKTKVESNHEFLYGINLTKSQ